MKDMQSKVPKSRRAKTTKNHACTKISDSKKHDNMISGSYLEIQSITTQGRKFFDSKEYDIGFIVGNTVKLGHK